MTRSDGRSPRELRVIEIEKDYTLHAEGSVLFSMGNTKVLCNVTIEDGAPRWMDADAGGWVTAEYSMLPRATHTRNRRETSGVRGRTHEIKRLIGRSLRGAVCLDKLGPRTCIVDCDVLQADGGTRTASITGGYIALALALRDLMKSGQIPEDTLKTQIAAISVGMVGGEPMVDLCYEEDSAADVDANIVMTGEGRFMEVQGTSEGQALERSALNTLLDLGSEAIKQLIEVQGAVLP